MTHHLPSRDSPCTLSCGSKGLGCGEPSVHCARQAISPLSSGCWKCTQFFALSDA
ncbi:expressed unknown protein [Ectocarpus siliculosus]|uniref:Uncharacterized protein n=1 Tax=Ectocarpus siliculosus TaxID=2880 RepID=D8LEM8_ECTSI|nr:expressed unknown protein [Ectocarpus siliculosus]|eukprot:CBN78591.1 expressed unknown protein [Ectocarpus siliculosus]